MYRIIIAIVLAAGIAGVAAGNAHAAQRGVAKHYRYKWVDPRGLPHYSDALTNDALKYGYDVMDNQGVVIRHIERPKTARERAADAASAARRAEAEAARNTRERNDRQMLLAYPTEQDLLDAQREQVDMLQHNLALTRKGFRRQFSSLAEILARAGEFEQSGKKVPRSVRNEIHQQRASMREQRQAIANKRVEIENTRKENAATLAHYRELSGAPASAASTRK